ncbi:MAG: hypothetical protein ACI8RD_008272 [Bacillariaceae sp.]|jgi:hypothetical protein
MILFFLFQTVFVIFLWGNNDGVSYRSFFHFVNHRVRMGKKIDLKTRENRFPLYISNVRNCRNNVMFSK